VSNANWFANKVAQQTGQQAPPPQQGRPVNMPPMPPSQQPMAQMPAFQQPVQSKAKSASLTSTCPDCGSDNYFAATPQNTERCFECGYPVQQSGGRYGSLAGAHVEGAAQQARGNDVQSNWNPQGIIGRID